MKHDSVSFPWGDVFNLIISVVLVATMLFLFGFETMVIASIITLTWSMLNNNE